MILPRKVITTPVYIGTSGWSYRGWIGNFYPAKIAANAMLSFYSHSFASVELNSSFYHLPTLPNLQRWYQNTPADFIFACKANRYLTHWQKLSSPDALQTMLTSFANLKEKLGPILFQLPPSWSLDLARLEYFLSLLPSAYHYVFEFRHISWLTEEVYDLLNKYNIALCFYDFKGKQAPEVLTANFVYLRLHGPEKSPYTGSYSEDSLLSYAKKIHYWQQQGKTVYCYFDNDQKAHAPANAKSLQQLLRAKVLNLDNLLNKK